MLSNRTKYRLRTFLAAAVLLWVAAFGAFSGSTQNEPANYETTNNSAQHSEEVATIINFVLAFATTILAIATLFLARSTQVAARSAKDSASIARDTLTKLERPHLRFTPLKHSIQQFWSNILREDSGAIRTEATIDFIFKNYGKYPAYITALHFSIVIEDKPPLLERATFTPLEGDLVIAPEGQTVQFKGAVGGSFELRQRRDARADFIWLFGKLIYGNVVGIGGDFETEFLWRYNPETGNLVRFDGAGPNRNRCT